MKFLTPMRNAIPKQQVAPDDARKAREECHALVQGMSSEELVALALGMSNETVRKMRQALGGEEASPATYSDGVAVKGRVPGRVRQLRKGLPYLVNVISAKRN